MTSSGACTVAPCRLLAGCPAARAPAGCASGDDDPSTDADARATPMSRSTPASQRADRARRRREGRRDHGRRSATARSTPKPHRVEVPLGSQVRLQVTSDVDDELHVHGFDIEEPLEAGQHHDGRVHRRPAGRLRGRDPRDRARAAAARGALTRSMASPARLLAHGVGSREDLPIPFSYARDRRGARAARVVPRPRAAVAGAAAATRSEAGWPLPDGAAAGARRPAAAGRAARARPARRRRTS